VEGKYNLFLKWCSFYKHVGEKNIGIDVQKGDWYYLQVSRHVKNQKLFASYSHEYVDA
jgi:hypothetical protein